MLEGKIPAKVSLRMPAGANEDDNNNNNPSGGGTLAALDSAASERYLLGELSEEHIVTSFGDSARVRQAQLQGTCAKLVLACVRHRCGCVTGLPTQRIAIMYPAGGPIPKLADSARCPVCLLTSKKLRRPRLYASLPQIPTN